MTGVGLAGATGRGGGASSTAVVGLRKTRRRVTLPAEVAAVLPTLPDPSSPRATAITIPPGEVSCRTVPAAPEGLAANSKIDTRTL
jgi:hypothetical protein